jgi:hypothetical protein
MPIDSATGQNCILIENGFWSKSSPRNESSYNKVISDNVKSKRMKFSKYWAPFFDRWTQKE